MLINVNTVREWITAKSMLTQVKRQELQLRKEICLEILGANTSGTKHAAIGDVDVTASASEQISVKKDILLEAIDRLTDQEKDVIDWKPSIVKSKYDALPADCELRRLAVLRIGSPTLKAEDLGDK